MLNKQNNGKAGRTRQDTGKIGEKIAARFLRSRGYSLLEANFITPFGEIDLITEQNGNIVFVEVKTRISEKFGPPLASITKTKKEHIIKNCLYYLKRHGQCSANYRIDAVGIKLTAQGELQFLRHVRGAIHL